jgi:hypothetical protein
MWRKAPPKTSFATELPHFLVLSRWFSHWEPTAHSRSLDRRARLKFGTCFFNSLAQLLINAT